jgi:hypothetical protein
MNVAKSSGVLYAPYSIEGNEGRETDELMHRTLIKKMRSNAKSQLLCLLGLLIVFSSGRSAFGEVAYSHDVAGNRISQVQVTLSPPIIVSQPLTQLVEPNASANFSVVVADASSVTYQWKFNSIDIPGATGDSLFLVNVTSGNEGNYTVTITNPSGTIDSSVANYGLPAPSTELQLGAWVACRSTLLRWWRFPQAMALASHSNPREW